MFPDLIYHNFELDIAGIPALILQLLQTFHQLLSQTKFIPAGFGAEQSHSRTSVTARLKGVVGVD